MSRPSDFTKELADLICAQLAEGVSLRSVCRAEDMPDKSTVFRWLRTKPEFRDQYARAKEESADALVEEMLDIADDGANDYTTRDYANGGSEVVVDHDHISRSRLRVDTRKWVAAKLKPKRYGDKIETTLQGPDGGPIQARITLVKPDDQDEP
jgi:hypothetical protein